jgi:hypothetical protein
MCDGRPIHTDVVVIAKFQEFSAGKLGAIVGDDEVRHSKPVDDVRKEGHGLFCPELRDWACLDPLGEFVHDDQQVGVAPGRDGFVSDTHGYECGCHYLPHFISNSDTNMNIIEYKYKTDISNSDSHSNTYSIYSIAS